HIELINLRNANASVMKQVGALNAEVRKLSDALAESESKADDLAARGGEALYAVRLWQAPVEESFPLADLALTHNVRFMLQTPDAP
ncbi:MAG: hypothetical protein ACK4P1_00510, partial [Aggregatilineales bacterium]